MNEQKIETGKQQPLWEFSQLLQLSTGLLILFGVTRLIYYYRGFGINILSFLDFGEILTSFFDVISIMVYSVAIILFQAMDYLFPPKAHEIDYAVTQKIVPPRYRTSILITLLLLITGYTLWFLIKFFTYISKDALWGIGFLLMLCFMAYMFRAIIKRDKRPVAKKTYTIAAIIAIGELFLLFRTSNEVKNVDKNFIYFGNEIILKDSSFSPTHSAIIKSDSIVTYIGKTNGFIFIYNRKTLVTSVLPMTAVQQINFKKRS